MMRHAGWRVALTVLVLALSVYAEDSLNGETVAAGEQEVLTATMTPQRVAQAQPGSVPPPTPEVIVEAQTLLTALGYKPGPVNGVWNERTKQAYREFLRDKALPAGETLTPAVLKTLRALARFGGGGPGGEAARPSAKAARPDALHRAAKAGNLEGLNAALAAGADVNARDGRSWTALMHAVNKGYVLLVEPLLAAKADPNLRAPDGATALFMASAHGHTEIIVLLMKAGADPKILGPNAKTAADVARTRYGDASAALQKNADPAVLALLAGKTWAEAKADEDDAAFARADSVGTLAAYAEYLAAYPQGRHAGRAEERQKKRAEEEADDAAYARAQAAGTEAAYEEYLSSYAEGRHAQDIVRQLRAKVKKRIRGEDDAAYARADSAGSEAAYAEYLAAYPQGRHAGRAEEEVDDAAYARVQAVGTEAAYAEYLSVYPQGRHAGEVRRLQAMMKEGPEKTEEAKRWARKWPAGTTLRDCDACPEMVVVPAGTYMMGSEKGNDDEKPVHQVTIEQPFAVGKYEVTFAEWEACVAGGGCNGYRPDDQGWGRGRRPVIEVSWEDAQNYVRWLSEQTGEAYRLLSEAEWEYVARAGATTRYTWGDEIGENRANCNGCGSRWDYKQTAPVGSFSANVFGLYDVHGNVWEWVVDCWNENYEGSPDDGRAWGSSWFDSGDCTRRVVRGGSWINVTRHLRSAVRYRYSAGGRDDIYGVRLARTLTP